MKASKLSSTRIDVLRVQQRVWGVVFMVFGVTMTAFAQGPNEAGVQVLTRGPVHEAFAEASMSGASAGMVIPKSPYNPISELPPDQRPEGGNVEWIPGYWSWEDDREDFIWVSGVWRDLPPGRQWVPGYWATVGDGSQWISGFWGEIDQTEVTYLPPPPQPLDVGPSSPRPGPDYLWSPGCWIWQQARYDWQPGYWVVQQPNWVWCPAHYTWTPRGYVYVPGYWDHDIVHRGVMFAPVYYDQPVYRQPSYRYSPSIVIDLFAIAAFLFVRPRSHHYYYGDYYDNRYEERGYYPWHSNRLTQYGDDTLYQQYRYSRLQHDPDWDSYIDQQFRYRRDHVDARPLQTLALQINFINNQTGRVPEDRIIARTLEETIERRTSPTRFTRISMDERKEDEIRGREIETYRTERARVERATVSSEQPVREGAPAQPVRLRLPASPVAARPVERVQGARVPPPKPIAPKPHAADARERSVNPATTERDTTPDRPGRATKPGKPEKTDSVVRVQPDRTKPETREQAPRRVVSKPESKKPEDVSRPAVQNPSVVQDEAVVARPPRETRTPETVTAPRPQRDDARPVTRPSVSPKEEFDPGTAEPRRAVPKPKSPKEELRRKQPGTNEHPARSHAPKKPKSRTPDSEEERGKKRGEQ